MTGRTRGRALLMMATVVFVACSASAGGGDPPPAAPSDGAVITAEAITFDRQQLDVPAGRPFPLLFENREGAPHNVRVYDEVVDQPLFVGEVFGGPGSRTYEVPSLPAGQHRFRCDVHPEMSGRVTAG